MKVKQIKSIVIGCFLIFISFVFFVIALNLRGFKYDFFNKKEGNIAGVSPGRSIGIGGGNSILDGKAEIDIEALVKESKSLYGEDEVKRKSGLLWFDRKMSKLIVTLGIVNGVEAGDVLAVYFKNENICEVRVKTALDIISYVELFDEELDLSGQDYYQVQFKSKGNVN